MTKTNNNPADRKTAKNTGLKAGAVTKKCKGNTRKPRTPARQSAADGGIQPEYLRIGYATLHLDQDGSLFLWIEGIGAYIGVFEDLFENHGLKDALRPGIKLLPREVEPVREAMKAWRHMIEMVGLN